MKKLLFKALPVFLLLAFLGFAICMGSWPLTTENLTADERIAEYTMWLALLTGAIVVTAIVQIGFLIRADNTARRSSDAVVAMELPIFVTEKVDIDITQGRFVVHLGNHGRTPAIVNGQCLVRLVDTKDLPKAPYYPKDDIIKNQRVRVVEKGYECSVEKVFEITEEQRKLILEGNVALWVYGYIDYLDFLKIERREGFCFKIKPLRSKIYPDMISDSVYWVQKGGEAYNYNIKKS